MKFHPIVAVGYSPVRFSLRMQFLGCVLDPQGFLGASLIQKVPKHFLCEYLKMFIICILILINHLRIIVCIGCFLYCGGFVFLEHWRKHWRMPKVFDLNSIHTQYCTCTIEQAQIQVLFVLSSS